jgi:hypothetical protein
MLFDEIEAAVRARQSEYPPQQSGAGTNTYTIMCSVVGWRPGYCVCLAKIGAYERDHHLKSYPDCERGIRNKDCPALELRREEVTAGKALYYVDRQLLREEMDRRFDAMQNSYAPARARSKPVSPAISAAPVSTSPAKPKDKPVPTPVRQPVVPQFDDGGYAAAINAAIRQSAAPAVPIAPVTKPEPKVADPSPSPVKKGPSLLELARMQMGKQPGVNQ